MLSEQNFYSHFQKIYSDRWPALFSALQSTEEKLPRWNKFTLESNLNAPTQKQIPRAENGMLCYYVMDPASIEVALALDAKPGEKILDMCAAPGGKSLILAEALLHEKTIHGELICNELSQQRRGQLKKVLQQYIPRDLRQNIYLTGKDGGKFALSHAEYFDRILLDAPCSGERHLLQNQKELQSWTTSRSKKLAHRQYALLSAALVAVKSGGRIVYSTCSISPTENDDIIEEIMRRKKDKLEVLAIRNVPLGGEGTKYGVQIFPDKSGCGPIYFCILQKY